MATTPLLKIQKLPNGIVEVYDTGDTSAATVLRKDVLAGPCRLLSVFLQKVDGTTPERVFLRMWNNADPTVTTNPEHEVIEYEKVGASSTDAEAEICNPPNGIKFDVGFSYSITPALPGAALATTDATYKLTLILKKGV